LDFPVSTKKVNPSIGKLRSESQSIIKKQATKNVERPTSIQQKVTEQSILLPTLSSSLLTNDLEKQLPLSDIKITPNQLPNPLGSRAIELSFYAGKSWSKGKNKTVEGNQFLATKNQYETTLYTAGLDLKYYHRISKNWSASAGIHYQRITDKLKLNETKVSTNSIASDSATFFVYTPDKIDYFPGTLTETITQTRMVQQYNHLDNIGFSLGVKAEKNWGIFSIFGTTHLAYFPWQRYSGKTMGEENQIIELSDAQSSKEFTKHLFNLQVEGGLQWRLTEGLHLSSSIQYRTDLNARIQTTDYQISYQSIGLKLGLIKKW